MNEGTETATTSSTNHHESEASTPITETSVTVLRRRPNNCVTIWPGR